MLEKPGVAEEKIGACLQAAYGLRVEEVVFLPLGVDQNAAVYRARTGAGDLYFVKLRRGAFDAITVRLPAFLHAQGIRQVIAPLATRSGRLWAQVEGFKLILYPFVAGRDGYAVALTAQQWVEFGEAVRGVHAARLPAGLLRRIPRETYSPLWREKVLLGLERVGRERFDDPVAVELAAFLREKREDLLELVQRAGRLAQALQARCGEWVVCHADLHAGNVLIDEAGRLFLVDWDNPILALKERDLMYPGGGQGFSGFSPQEEEGWFYQGYDPARGAAAADPAGLAFYRCERIVEDVAIFCEQILASDQGGEDRSQALRYLKSNFLPGGTIELAYRADRR